MRKTAAVICGVQRQRTPYKPDDSLPLPRLNQRLRPSLALRPGVQDGPNRIHDELPQEDKLIPEELSSRIRVRQAHNTHQKIGAAVPQGALL